MSEAESLILQILREMRAELGDVRSDIGQIRADFATKSDMHTLRADVAADLLSTRKEISEQIVGLRRAVIEYHTSVIGHGVLISELEARVRRVELADEHPVADDGGVVFNHRAAEPHDLLADLLAGREEVGGDNGPQGVHVGLRGEVRANLADVRPDIADVRPNIAEFGAHLAQDLQNEALRFAHRAILAASRSPVSGQGRAYRSARLTVRPFHHAIRRGNLRFLDMSRDVEARTGI